MKEKNLRQGKRRERYGLKAFLWGMLIAALFIVPSIIKDHGMYLYYGDYNFQVIPFYQLMVDSIHSGDVGWNWYTDLGSGFVGSYSFYNLGSPFFLFLLLFPGKAVPYVMGPLTIFKFGVSSFTAYLFLRRYTKNKNNAVIGAMLYAFSGAAIYNMVFHFIDAMAFFPLLPAALDSYVYDKKKGRFALAAALCAVTNYYLFIAEVVFMLIFWIVRAATGSYKMDSRSTLYLIFEAIIGTGIGTAILLPTVYHIAGNSRMSGDSLNGWNMWVYEAGYAYFNTFISFFLPPEFAQLDIYVPPYQHTWSSITGYLPLFGMAGVFAVIFNKQKNKWIRVFYGVCTLFMFVPLLNSSFQLFSNFVYLRWFFMLLLVMSLGSVTALEDPSTKWKKAIVCNLAITMVLIVILGLTPVRYTAESGLEKTQIGLTASSGMLWNFGATAMINIALCVLFVSLYKKNKDVFRRFSALIVSIALVVTMASTYLIDKKMAYKGGNPVKYSYLGHSGDETGIDDIQNWRSENVIRFIYSKYMCDADSLETDDYAYLKSQNDLFLTEFEDIVEGEMNVEVDNTNMFWRIPGFSSFHSTINSYINKLYKGLGYDRTTLSNLPLGMYGARTAFGTKYYFEHEKSSYKLIESDDQPKIPGLKYLKTWNGYKIYENEYAVPIGTVYKRFMVDTDFEQIPVPYRHLVLCDAIVVSSIDQVFNLTAAGLEQVNADDYDFTRDEYVRNCEALKKSSVYDFERSKKGFEAKYDSGEKEEYVFFSVPFDHGWSAKVNGKDADIEIADYGFMLVKVPANTKNTITFTYHTQGTIYGAFVTGICLLMLLIYLAVMKMKDAREEDELAAKKAAKPEYGSSVDAEKEKADAESKEKESDGTDENKEETREEEMMSDNIKDEENLDEMSVFDIVKQTEEQTMMHVYKRVPVVLERGEGAVGYDIDNKKYIDFTSGIGVNALGYADGRWCEAVIKQVYSVQHTSNLYYNTTQIQLAEMLCMKTGFSKVFFANSGAEANECAIKIARKYGSDRFGEKHTHIITLENSFHGRTITTLSATGQDVFHKHFTPFTEGFSFAKANDMDSIKECTKDDTCAVMIELIQGEGGVNPLDKQFVTDLAQYCKDNDLLLIVDEIQTGVGRTGKLYCYENFGIEPDVITSAKALSGGLPLSACLCNEKLKDVLGPGSNGTTFGGNPIACAGALKILDIVGEEDFLAEVRRKGEYMRERIKEMKGVKEVRGMGMMIGIVLERDNAGDVLAKCAENGLLVLTAKGLIRLLPPLSIEDEDIDEGLEILARSIEETMGDASLDEK